MGTSYILMKPVPCGSGYLTVYGCPHPLNRTLVKVNFIVHKFSHKCNTNFLNFKKVLIMVFF